VFAVHEAVSYAADKARRGDGPTYLELLTYRVSAHSCSDDPSRYRDESVTDVWRNQKDPLRRTELFLTRRGWLAAGEREALAAEIEHTVRDSIAKNEATPPPPRASLIEDVYEHPPWHLREQLEQTPPAPPPTHGK
jgi:TPP-dependent pyruvate/acetoin dehydrogenase alpha subunit